MIDYLTKLNIKPDESAEQPCSSIISSARSSIIWENNTMNEIKIKLGDIVTTTRGQKRGRVVQFSSDKTIAQVDFFDGTTKEFLSQNLKRVQTCQSSLIK